MKTIEERYKCTQERCSYKCPLYHLDAKMCLQHWAIKFAAEQKSIDIDKACLVYEKELREIVRVVNVLRKGVGDCISIEGCVKDFRKAMEE